MKTISEVIRFSVIAATLVIVLTPNLRAQTETYGEKNPIYIGAGAGVSFWFAKDDTRFKGDEKNNPVVFRGYLGYRLHRFFGLEAGYVTFGKKEFDGTWEYVEGYPQSDKGDISGGGVQLAALGMLPMSGPVTVFGKLGIIFWSLKESEVFAEYPEEHDASGSTPLVGAGAEFDLVNVLALRLEWDYYFEVGKEEETGKGPIHMVVLGAIVRIGG
ncbi:MAG: outer membrane beta-barrel protein [Bacteroidetes bacterium]|nr:outer membrane beta-barrel protein [Bacteroidota bacterium]